MTDEARTILLIEDDEVDREAVHRLLDHKYEVQSAATGAGGLEMARRLRPAAVLLDYRLPDIDGIDILSDLLAQDLPVVMLTVEENPEVIVDAMKQGAHDYLLKRQMTTAALDRAITNAAEKVALKQEIEAKQDQVTAQAALLEQQNQQIRELASALTLAEQRERRRIAQTLHDNLQQTLHGMHVRLMLLSADIPSDQQEAAYGHLDELETLLNNALEIVRTLTVDLSPPLLKGEGLSVAFEWLAGQMKRRHNLTIELMEQSAPVMENEDLRILIFQMVRELLFNVVKHAQVDQARLEIDQEADHLIIQASDNGVGFDTGILEHVEKSSGFGLYSIRERLKLFGGRLEIESQPGRGVRAILIVPTQPARGAGE